MEEKKKMKLRCQAGVASRSAKNTGVMQPSFFCGFQKNPIILII